MSWVVTVSTAIVLCDIRGRADRTWHLILLAVLVAFNPFVPIRVVANVRVITGREGIVWLSRRKRSGTPGRGLVGWPRRARREHTLARIEENIEQILV